METMQESNTSTYSFKGMAGIAFDTHITALGTTIHFEMDLLFGGHVETVKSKGKESDKSFGLSVELTGDNDLQLYVNNDEEKETYRGRINEGGGAYYEEGNPVQRPGKVDAYRFMTFYLEPSKSNFEDFFNKLVDPIWLEESDDPKAVALRQTNDSEKKPKCWRLLHMVIFVSRILPEISAKNNLPIEKAMKSLNVSSNFQLIQKMEPYVKNKIHNVNFFRKAVKETLQLYLPELVPHEIDVINFSETYYDVQT